MRPSDDSPAWLPSDGGRNLRTRSERDVHLERILGGEWRPLADSSCFVVEHRHSPSHTLGDENIGIMANRLEQATDALQLLTGNPALAPYVFFDLETTGLSGGAGTRAFLVGCGWFEHDGAFVTRQYLLVRVADELRLLGSIALELTRAGSLVSFNGKSFDAPLLESRYLYHRLEWVGARLPHLDMVHVARRFWGSACGDIAEPEPPGRNRMACSLIALEQRLLGTRRHGDVPGFEIPSRYFHFLRTGDAYPLRSVFEHNRLDLLSLAALTARAVSVVREGPAHVRDPREALALGRIYGRAGLEDRAREAYERAIHLSSGPTSTAPSTVYLVALRAQARTLRRLRRYQEAAGHWRQILEVRGCPRHVASEASEALAIHHEHRVRDLAAARTFAIRGLREAHPAWNEAMQHRLARIQRKMESFKPDRPSLTFSDF